MRGDRIKVLLWEDEPDQRSFQWTDRPANGLVMAYKRLEQGKFAWPGISDGVMRLSKGQFEALFEGLAPLSAIALQSPVGQWAAGSGT